MFQDIVLNARQHGASDIHLTVGRPPVYRINGDLSTAKDYSETEVINRIILSILDAEQEERLRAGDDLDFVLEFEDGSRQRVNIYRQMGKLACAIRLLNSKLPSMEDLNLPPVLKDVAKKRSGLVLVTGMSGSGKTTTMSLILDFINKTRPCHIITVEDPVEYRHVSKRATIHQREVGRDVKSFQAALKSSLREDPDVIFIGEMRDYETMQLAVTAAETGHLVMGTLHTRGAVHTVNRIVDACPADIQQQMTAQLSQSLECVISQALLPLENGGGRIAAIEVLIGTDAVKNIIRAGKSHQLESSIQQGKNHGMCLMDDEIIGLYRSGKISRATAMDFANDRPAMSTRI